MALLTLSVCAVCVGFLVSTIFCSAALSPLYVENLRQSLWAWIIGAFGTLVMIGGFIGLYQFSIK